MVKRINNGIIYLTYLYLTLPILIFVIGWIKLPIAIICVPMILIALYRCMKNERNAHEEFWSANDIIKFGAILGIIFFWVYLSGIGGLCYQNSDQAVRNVIYQALVEYDWPVVSSDGSKALIYYIGFWFPAAVIGKIFGLTMGYWFQAVWSVAGIFLVYYFICMRRKKVEYWPLFLLIFFSGMDYLGAWLLGRQEFIDLFYSEHLEWWINKYQYSSMTTQLFWVFNQAIPAWLGTVLVLNQKNKKNLFFILSHLILSATFPFVGLIPIVLYFALKKREGKVELKENFSFQNMVGVFIIGIISVAYLLGNGQVVKSQNMGQENRTTIEATAEETGTGIENKPETDSSSTDFSVELLIYILFVLIEFLPYVFLIYKGNKVEPLFYVIVAILLVCPLVSLGDSYDFCMRASIPALFCLMIYCMDFLTERAQNANYKLVVPMVIILLIGSITPFNEIHRNIKDTIMYSEQGRDYAPMPISAEGILDWGYHCGETQNNLFMKYFAK